MTPLKQHLLIKPAISILIILFGIIFNTYSQESLIQNGSFEENTSCYGDPANLGFDVFQWAGCTGWTCPTYGSSDFWCENPGFGSYEPPATPFGFEYPRTGENMAGIYLFVKHEEYREYIQCKTTAPLKENGYYEFSLYLNNPFYNENLASTTSCFQAYFSHSPVLQPTSYLAIPVEPQLKNDPANFYTDTTQWILFEGTYKASGGENYITIGCFDTDFEIPLSFNIISDSTVTDIYFFIDDVQLHEIPSSLKVPNIFTPDNDGVNDLFYPTLLNIPDWEMNIMNRWGNQIITLNPETPYWDGNIGNNAASEGIYFYTLRSSNQTYNQNGFFQLIK
ncbi:gliding motility-associated C-terminal domain-containing protein [uncultured Fluviicola sp.]|uniref:T9SS type B sorting domain-containing protein n=1 Tax=uncultured Fluviicola sp. TaxID=463303 RepID=UPI0025D9D69E|nr:gliding motility-associated C-terminal domain-containing protein [uncultured Fluviicola sp.]